MDCREIKKVPASIQYCEHPYQFSSKYERNIEALARLRQFTHSAINHYISFIFFTFFTNDNSPMTIQKLKPFYYHLI